MKFVNPFFLFGLFAIAIPIIIHLFNFRKFKKVYFTNVRFLKAVQQETQSRSKLRHLLVLLSRILAIIFLVLAFAQPYIPAAPGKKVFTGTKAVSIFIDNSFSMNATNKNGSLLDDAKKKALEIVNAYKPTDRFQLLTNDFQGWQQRLVDKEAFKKLLDNIKISPAVKTLPEILSRQFDALSTANSPVKQAFVISDFQKSISNLKKLNNDTSVHVTFIPVIAQEKNNLYIDTCWFNSPVHQTDEVEKLHVRIRNKSDNAISNNSIKLFVDGKEKTPASFSVAAGASTEAVLSFVLKQPGVKHCRVQINDYPVTFDDKFYFSFTLSGQIPVLSINAAKTPAMQVSSQNDYIRALYGNDSLFTLTSASGDNLDYSTLGNYRLIVLNGLQSVPSGMAQELKRFVSNGGSLLIFPGTKIETDTYREFLSNMDAAYYDHLDTAKNKVDWVNYSSPIYRDVFEKKPKNIDLPVVNQHYVITRPTRSTGETLLKLENGDVFLTSYDYNKGKVYLAASPLDPAFSNFPRHAVFVPTLYKIAIFSQPYQPLFYTIDKDNVIEVPNARLSGDNVFHIKGVENSLDVIPETRLVDLKTDVFVHNQIKQAGNYDLYAAKKLVTGLAFNYDRKESDLDCYTPDQLSSIYSEAGLKNFSMINAQNKSLTQTLTEIDHGTKLWKLCIILALLFLAIEVLLLRRWKGSNS